MGQIENTLLKAKLNALVRVSEMVASLNLNLVYVCFVHD